MWRRTGSEALSEENRPYVNSLPKQQTDDRSIIDKTCGWTFLFQSYISPSANGVKSGITTGISNSSNAYGWSTGAHLDFRLKVNGQYQDPFKYVMAVDRSKNNQTDLNKKVS